MSKQAVLLLTQLHDGKVLKAYNNLSVASSHFAESYILYHKRSTLPYEFSELRLHTFTDSILNDLGCTPLAPKIVPGSCHFPLYDFFLACPEYDYYWLIEDDVHFEGDWRFFFEECSQHYLEVDFLASHIYLYDQQPLWRWWDSLCHPNKFIPFDLRLRSFNPIYRISKSARPKKDEP
ncbi:hypothetical protein C8P68_1147 [Mucilaginibacter yixingensis]|uniref:Glycosyl transferase family 25 n=1 Tax=Mucilaginibacter yixingensis TaxID=1295612 RepID=A0A2T5J4H3_9SPHI|nr:hypothetical protein [Mucilaginibacter yixingensis]PTQ92132.1 hypothetical protein C8P68_1147 [Mucilaginibacter yixingensis]